MGVAVLVAAVAVSAGLAGSAGTTVGAVLAAGVAGAAAGAGAALAWFSLAISAFFSSIRRCMSVTFFSSWASFDSASLSLRCVATSASAWACALACAARSALLSFSSSR
ncbi:hypothetical protein D3C81_2071870 [compost metagenome]